ncbi:MAG: hypothetical protein WCK90_02040 [archaeon]
MPDTSILCAFDMDNQLTYIGQLMSEQEKKKLSKSLAQQVESSMDYLINYTIVPSNQLYGRPASEGHPIVLGGKGIEKRVIELWEDGRKYNSLLKSVPLDRAHRVATHIIRIPGPSGTLG